MIPLTVFLAFIWRQPVHADLAHGGTLVPGQVLDVTQYGTSHGGSVVAHTRRPVTVLDECSLGVIDCACVVGDCRLGMLDVHEATMCSTHVSGYASPGSQWWTLVLGIVFGALLAFSLGTDDAANCWGISVGSGAIGLTAATLVGGVMELAGASLMGYGVSQTISSDLVKLESPECYACGYCDSSMGAYPLVMLSGLIAAVIGSFLTALTAVPMAAIHAVVSGAIGASYVFVGRDCIRWTGTEGVLWLLLFWATTPLLAGLIGAITHYMLSAAILHSSDPVGVAAFVVPMCGFMTTFLTLLCMGSNGTPLIGRLHDMLKFWVAMLISLIVAVCIGLFTVPWCRRTTGRVLPLMLKGSRRPSAYQALDDGAYETDLMDQAHYTQSEASHIHNVVYKHHDDFSVAHPDRPLARFLGSHDGTASSQLLQVRDNTAHCVTSGGRGGEQGASGAPPSRSIGELPAHRAMDGVTGRQMVTHSSEEEAARLQAPECERRAALKSMLSARRSARHVSLSRVGSGVSSYPQGDEGSGSYSANVTNLLRASYGADDAAHADALVQPIVNYHAHQLAIMYNEYAASADLGWQPPEHAKRKHAAGNHKKGTDAPGAAGAKGYGDGDGDGDGSAGETELQPVTRTASEAARAEGDRRARERRKRNQPGIDAVSDQEVAFELADPDDVTETLQYHYIPVEARIMMFSRPQMLEQEHRQAVWLFKWLLVFQAALLSFSHGANDVSNAAGPLIAIFSLHNTGIHGCTISAQWPVLLVTGAIVALGVATLGRKVIQTVSIELAEVNYMRGWTAAFAATLVVMIATMLRIPISTVHCQVGAVAAVGFTAFGVRSGSWDLFFRTLLAWLVTLPVCGLLGAAVCYVLSFTL